MYILLLLLLTITFSIQAIKQEKLKYFYLFVALVFSLLSFFIIPQSDFDLDRHYQNLDVLRNMNIVDSLNNSYIYKDLPISNIYLFLISKLQINGFLPAISAFLIYGLTGLTVRKTSIYLNCPKKYEVYGYLCFIFMFNYLEVMGIRQFVCFSVFFYFLFIDLVQKEKKTVCFLVYITLCFAHSSMIVLLALRLIFSLSKTAYSNKYLYFIIVFWGVGLNSISIILGLFPDISFLFYLNKTIALYFDNSFTFGNELFTQLTYLSRVSTVLVTLLAVYHCLYKNKIFERYTTFILLLTMFSLGGLFNFFMVIRFAGALYFTLPILVMLICINRNEIITISRPVWNTNSFLLICMILLMVISQLCYLFLFQYPTLNFSM